MTSIAIVGDGPGGLSAALFLAKTGNEVTVFGTDKTAMHYAYLSNYLGIPEVSGTEFQKIARQQVHSFGARILDEQVTSVEVGDSFIVKSADSTVEADYLIFTEGKNPELARAAGLSERQDGGLAYDQDYRSSVDRVYVVGRSARPERSQAIISAGAGATAALDILARETGKDVQDWDSPPKEETESS
jgi:thioredoxin reductase (NADPH)